jgi:hypothetical protein
MGPVVFNKIRMLWQKDHGRSTQKTDRVYITYSAGTRTSPGANGWASVMRAFTFEKDISSLFSYINAVAK